MITTENWSEIVAGKDAKIAELEALVNYYEGQLRLAKHRQFGSSSEKGEVPEQLGCLTRLKTPLTRNCRNRSWKKSHTSAGNRLASGRTTCPHCLWRLWSIACRSRSKFALIAAERFIQWAMMFAKN